MAKRLIIFSFLIFSILFFNSEVFSFTSVQKTTFTAAAVIASSGTVSISVQLRNLAGGTTTQVWWDTSGITIGPTDWRRSDSYILLSSTITDAAGGIQIYTDNKGVGANPSYSGLGDPAGLVAAGTTNIALPMTWRVSDISTNTLNIIQGVDNKLYSSELGGQGSGFPCFFWMKDRNTAGFTDGEDYITVKDINGVHFAEGANYGLAASPDYIYFGGKFQSAVGPETYKTTTIRIEAFIE